jgi:uncharacterized protein YdhG (YjbR/CyaY superfamily)
MDAAVQAYVDAIDPAFRPLFDRVHALILATHPDAAVVISYGMPTYRVGRSRLHVGVWRHGVPLYGWGQEAVAAFTGRHPGLRTSKGTIQLRPEDADAVSDDELCDVIRAALGS